MSTPFQNRLVGTIIVAAIAIIVLPDVLDGEKKTYQDNFTDIPAAPEVSFEQHSQSFPKEKLAQLPEPVIHDEPALDDVGANEPTNVINDDKVAVNTLKKAADFTSKAVDAAVSNKGTEKKSLPAKAVPKQAWVIQLGSFRHQNNVDELVNKLKANGYTAFTKPIKTKNGNLTKVFVGPELIKKSLEDKLAALKKLTNVEGKIARFTPAKG